MNPAFSRENEEFFKFFFLTNFSTNEKFLVVFSTRSQLHVREFAIIYCRNRFREHDDSFWSFRIFRSRSARSFRGRLLSRHSRLGRSGKQTIFRTRKITLRHRNYFCRASTVFLHFYEIKI